ncbi:MAG TPA: helix-turn-helix transcriptional regulator [Saprospiraceae bacterium]|nr:helix-turn-helix transcriptional regulator [Saprospiraceae bacterium]
MKNIIHIKSIAEAHKLTGLLKQQHPLISVVRQWPKVDIDISQIIITSELYIMSLKASTGSLRYGKNNYDYQEGTLVFTAPNQALVFDNDSNYDTDTGWSIMFHPDLIRKSTLATEIRQYSFFDYSLNEALHLSDKEKEILNDFVRHIEIEINQNIDRHSQELIVSNLESILKYTKRFYDRQFFTRTNQSKDYLIKFELFLKNYFETEELIVNGLPTVAKCGEALNMSAHYLSDLLKTETGRTAKDHIHDYVIDKAKNLLLGSNQTIGEIAYKLGFDYPQHFAKIFKAKTGQNPTDYRELN